MQRGKADSINSALEMTHITGTLQSIDPVLNLKGRKLSGKIIWMKFFGPEGRILLAVFVKVLPVQSILS